MVAAVISLVAACKASPAAGPSESSSSAHSQLPSAATSSSGKVPDSAPLVGRKMSNNWRQQVAALAQSAQESYAEGDVASAANAIDSAFAIVAADGSESDIVFAVVLLTAADIASKSGDVESGASLYRRAADTCEQLRRGAPATDTTDDLDAIEARANLGLARADLSRGFDDRARLRYTKALNLMQRLPDVPLELVEEARRGSQSTSR